ncbi:unnamed protein product, partial [Leptidea sinapis]
NIMNRGSREELLGSSQEAMRNSQPDLLSAFERPLTREEKNFLLNADRGDYNTQYSSKPEVLDINCVDPLNRSALIAAIENENIELIKLLLDAGIKVKDALLHAIKEEYVEAVEMLLQWEEEHHVSGEPYSWESVEPSSATFTTDITPLILAAHRNHYEILKLLLDRGATLPVPHDVNEDSLRHSQARINSYRALSSPSLIALSSADPVLTAFELSWELNKLSRLETEFRVEYKALRQQVQEFATSLLDHTRTSQELEIMLNYNPLDLNCWEPGERQTLGRLKLAIRYKQKMFVAHPNVQQLLGAIWYDGLPGFKRKTFVGQCIQELVEYWKAHERGSLPGLIEFCVIVYIASLIWGEIRSLWSGGLVEYISDLWNIVDFITNMFYISWIILRVSLPNLCNLNFNIHQYFQRDYHSGKDPWYPRERWDSFDPMLLSEGAFAAGMIFSFLKLVHIFSINPHLGPLQVSLGRMILDILKFFFVYMLVLFAFGCGKFEPTDVVLFRVGETLFETSQSLFWASFGLVDLTTFELTGIKSFTRFWALLTFGSYSVINIIVLLNMLIAMMSNSYQIISNKNREKARQQHDAVMRVLVRRYVTAEQRARDDIGVTEDDVMEIRQDISTLRFELIDILASNGMKTPRQQETRLECSCSYQHPA